MVVGFCNTRRSVTFMLLMVLFSNAQRQSIQTSAASVDTDCPVERLESQLASIVDQLNRMQRIVSTLNNPLLKGNCTIDLASYGHDDSTKYGYVRTSGGSSDEVLVLDELGNHRSVHRGMTLFELNPTTCTTRNRQRFDTHASADDRVQLLETLESATTGTIIVGVTADSTENGVQFQNTARSFFTKYNMNLSGLQTRDKIAFILQKGYPKKTVFQRKPQYGESLRMKVALRGSTVSDVTFSRV